jgi:LacI family transcriptional regulator
MREESSQRLPPRAVYELLGEASLVSAKTLDRVSALAKEHRARADRRRLIGVAMYLGPWMLRLKSGQTRRHAFFDDVLFGIRARADAGNVDVLILTGTASQFSGEASHYLDLCRRHGAEGIILSSFHPDEPELAEIVSSGFPAVAIDAQLFGPRTGFVSSDNVDGAATAVRHLADLGRKRIAYLDGWGPELASADRRLGYESALSECGLELRKEYVLLGGWSHVRAYELTQKALKLPEPPDAFFCASDVMAIGAIRAIQESGLRIPEDVSVIGFDDSAHATLMKPSLTSVRQDCIGLGTAAVEAMLRMLDDPESPPPSIVLPVELIVRESSSNQLEQEPDGPTSTAVEPVIGEPSSRLLAEALYEMLGDINNPSPKTPGDTSPSTRHQEWRAEKRPLIALAAGTAPGHSFRHAFFDGLFYEIRARAYVRGIDLLIITGVGTTPGIPFPPFLELCEKYRVQGLVVISLAREEPPVAALAGSDFPCVALDIDLLSDRIAFVMSDNVSGAVKVTQHLIEIGRRRIAFIGGRGDERPSVDRRFGYQSELAYSGLTCPEEYLALANWLPDRAFEATRAFLALPEPPDAIFCASDVMAIGAMAAVEAAGLKVPDDIAVVGFDDIDYARLVKPSLTTVRQSQDALAEGLIAAMLGLLDNPDERPMVSVIPVELIVRASTSG